VRRAGEALLVATLLALAFFLLPAPRASADLRFDSLYYAAQSVNLAEGRGNTLQLGGETVPGFYPPGQPACAAPLHWLLGADPQNPVLLSGALGAVTTLLVYCLGRRLAGPVAGAAAALLFLSCPPVRDVSRRILAQPLSLAGTAGVALLWARGARAGAGFLAGLLPLSGARDLALPVALAAAAPFSGGGARGALRAGAGLAAGGALLVAVNLAAHGRPLGAGYVGWGLPTGSWFSLGNVLHPEVTPPGEGPWFLLRSLTGFGPLYPWPVAALALVGVLRAPPAFRALAAAGTLVPYLLLAPYWFRSILYLLPTLPFVFAAAAAGAVALCPPRLRALPVALAAAATIPAWPHASLIAPPPPAPLVATLRAVDRAVPPDAALLGAVHPVLAEYTIRRAPARRYLFLNPGSSPDWRRAMERELGGLDVGGWVAARLSEGRTVCALLLTPDAAPEEQAALERTWRTLEARFGAEPAGVPGLVRLRAR
jgi:hypothetical protein